MKEFEKYTDFTNMFRRDVTLRMRLEPVTIENGEVKFLEKSAFEFENSDGKTQLSTNDVEFYDDYKKLKPIIDKYHQHHIQKCLDGFVEKVNEENGFNSQLIELEGLRMAKENDTEKEKEERKEKADVLVGSLCMLISSFMKKDTSKFYADTGFDFSKLSKKEFFEVELNKFAEEQSKLLTEDEIALIHSLNGQKSIRMAQYCKTLFKNRENVYGVKKNSVAYRCIHENLFRFWRISNNVRRFCNILGEDYLSSSLSQEIRNISNNLTSIKDVFSTDMYYAYLSQNGIDKLNNLITAINRMIPEHNNSLNSLPIKERRAQKLYKLNTLHKQILSDKEVVIDMINNEHELEEKVIETIEQIKSLGLVGNDEPNKIKELLSSMNMYNTGQIYLDSNKLYHVSLCLFNDGMKLRNMIEWRKDNRPKRKFVSIQEINSYINGALDWKDVNVCDYFTNLKAKDAETETMTNLFMLISDRYQLYAEQAGNFSGARKTAFKKLLDVVIILNRTMKSLSCPEDCVEYDDAFYELYNEYINELREIDHNYNLIRNYVIQVKEPEEQYPLYFNEDAGEFLNGWSIVKNMGTKHKGYLFREAVGEINGQIYYDYYLGISTSPSLFKERKTTEKQKTDSKLQRFIYYQTKENTFRGNQFESANGKLVKLAKYEDDLYNKMLKYINEHGSELLRSKVYKEDEVRNIANTYLKLSAIIENVQPELIPTMMSDPDVSKKECTLREKLLITAHSIKKVKELKLYKPSDKSYAWNIYNDIKTIISTCRLKEYEWVDSQKLKEALAGVNNKGKKVAKLHLFRISNKDLNYFTPNTTLIGKIQREGEKIRQSHGRDNLHTMFFRSMMNDEESVFDIGTGKILFRRASIEKKETHKPGKLKNKNILNPKDSSEFKYSLYKDKRFARDQMTLHLSMVQNYKVTSNSTKDQLNACVRDYIYNTKEKFNIIGIDRGERNLLYVTLMKQDGTIIRQKSLNLIIDNQHNIKVDYHHLLKEKEDKIKKQKEDWDEIDKISNLKEGYLSQAVHEIAKMAVENKAIIVMEKLSEGFKSVRQKYLSNVYQLFEKMLVRKLSFYTDKTIDKNAPGGILNALQLVATDSVELSTPNNDVVQNGIIFYVPAWMTSKIDPATGFANLFRLSFNRLSDAREMIGNFSKIGYDKKKKEFVFSFDYRKFGVEIDSVNNWTIGTHGSRIVFAQDEKGYPMRRTINNLTNEFREFFRKYDVKISEDMKSEITNYEVASHPSVTGKVNLDFFEDLFRHMRYMLQLRNSNPDASDERDKDYIISPVIMPKGKYYLSSDYLNINDLEKQEMAKLPVDSDANGAYNIARKGIIVLEQIKKQKKTIKIEEKDWLAFAQKKYKESL